MILRIKIEKAIDTFLAGEVLKKISNICAGLHLKANIIIDLAYKEREFAHEKILKRWLGDLKFIWGGKLALSNM